MQGDLNDHSTIHISWPPSVAGANYRVVMKEDGEETGKTIYVGSNTQCDLPEKLQDQKHYTIRIDHNQGPNGAFTTLMVSICLSEWYPYREPSVLLEIPPVEGATYYRFVIKDTRSDQNVIDRRAISPRLQVPISQLYSTGKYSWRAQSYKNGEWKGCGPSVRLHYAYATAKTADTQLDTNVPELLFILSIDTEGQLKRQRDPKPERVVDEHIFCKTAHGELGIHYQMDALEKRDAKGTFFVDILMAYEFGEAPTRQCIDAIMERGHDVQLHLHPTPHLCGADDPTLRDIGERWGKDYSVDAFRDALDLAYNLFYNYTGQKPIAFRNGAYHLQNDYFPILAEYGIMVDSTMYSYKNCQLNGDNKSATLPFLHPSGVLELPVGWLGVEDKNGQRRSTQFTVKYGTYGNYLIQMIQESHNIFAGHGIVPLNFILHSYSFLKDNTLADAEDLEKWNECMKAQVTPHLYPSFKRTSNHPLVFTDGIHYERLESFNALLDAVAANPAIKIVTFKDIYETYFERLKTQFPASYSVPIYYPATGEFKTSAFQAYSPSYLKQLCGQIT